MADRTLVADQLQRAVENQGIIEQFDPGCLEGASYDFRAGDRVVRARPDAQTHEHLALHAQDSIKIEPGHAYLVYSREEVDLPADVKGRLSLRAELANKKLLYSGGLIDPGYEGELYFTIFNLGTGTFELEYEDRIVSGEFVQIEETESYSEKSQTGVSEAKLPPLPSKEREMRNWGEMNKLLTDYGDRLDTIENDSLEDISDSVDRLEQDIEQTDALINNIILTVIGGTLAGIFAGVTVHILANVL